MQNSLGSILETKGREIHSATPTTPISEAVREMHDHRVGSMLIMDGGRLAGILTERDVLFRVVDQGIDPTSTPVSRVMTENPKTVSTDMSVEEAMREVSDSRIRHLPLVDGDKVVGLVSSGDLTRWVVDAQKEDITGLQQEVKKEGFKFKTTIALVVAFVILIAVGVVTS